MIGEAVKQRRDALGLTQRALAMEANTTAAAVSHIERGQRQPSADLLARLASALDCRMDDLLTGSKKYSHDLTRDVTSVGIGSGRLCEQLPYPVMRRMVLDHSCRGVMDLGCGDMAFLAGLCKLDSRIKCLGIDYSEEMVRYNKEKLARNDYGGRISVQRADMFNLEKLSETQVKIDCITACDTFHEYLDQEDRLVELLRDLRGRFPAAIFVIGEFCLQDPQWLRRHRTASLEHHLFHQLSNQQIGTSGQWREIFSRAGLKIIEEQIFDLIGHGYFALR